MFVGRQSKKPKYTRLDNRTPKFRTATDGWLPESYDDLLRIVQTGMGWEDKLVTVSTVLFVLRLARAEKCPAIKVSDLEPELAQVCSNNRKFTSSISHRRL